MDACRDVFIEKVLRKSRELIELADEAEADCDDGCAVLFGVVRDCAYKMRGQAEKERNFHMSGKLDKTG